MPTTPTTRTRPTDRVLTCPCCGRSAIVRAATWNRLHRLEAGAFERRVHQLAGGSTR